MSNLPIDIDPAETKQLLDSGSVVLIDCREQSEWDTAHIEGAVLIPMSNWANEIEQLKQYESSHIVVHCHHGGRSLRVTNWMRQNGFPRTQNMTGGIDAWSDEVDANVAKY